MAHYAFIDENNIVVQVITGVDENVEQYDGDVLVGGSSEAWEQFYEARAPQRGLICKRTSYNGKFRKNYAGIGFTWRADLDGFVSPKPFPSWILNETNCRWEAPVAHPSDGKNYVWNEDEQEWQIDGDAE